MYIIVALDAHGNGGIERVTREVRLALAEDCWVLSLARPQQGDNKVGRASRWRKLYFALNFLWLTSRFPDSTCIVTHAAIAPLAKLANALFGTRYVVVCHGIEVWNTARTSARGKGLLASAGLWAVSDFTAARLVEQGLASPSDIRRIHLSCGNLGTNGNHSTRIAGRLLSVARLTVDNRYKGIDSMLEAFPRILEEKPGTTWHVVGAGDDAIALKKRAIALEVDEHISWLGGIDDDALAQEYAAASIFVMPGRADVAKGEGEGFGIVFVEAGLFGIPAVAGCGAGAEEAVIDQVTGIVCDGRDPDNIAASVLELLRDESLRDRLGGAARDRAGRFHSPVVFQADVLSALDSLKS